MPAGKLDSVRDVAERTLALRYIKCDRQLYQVHVRNGFFGLFRRCCASCPSPSPITLVKCARTSVLDWNLADGVHSIPGRIILKHVVLHGNSVEHHLIHVIWRAWIRGL